MKNDEESKKKKSSHVVVIILVITVVIILVTGLFLFMYMRKKYPVPFDDSGLMEKYRDIDLYSRKMEALRGNYPSRGPYSNRYSLELLHPELRPPPPPPIPAAPFANPTPVFRAISARKNRPPRLPKRSMRYSNANTKGELFTQKMAALNKKYAYAPASVNIIPTPASVTLTPRGPYTYDAKIHAPFMNPTPPQGGKTVASSGKYTARGPYSLR
jgi:hypothetical protein